MNKITDSILKDSPNSISEFYGVKVKIEATKKYTALYAGWTKYCELEKEFIKSIKTTEDLVRKETIEEIEKEVGKLDNLYGENYLACTVDVKEILNKLK